MALDYTMKINEEALDIAQTDMEALETRAINLKTKLEQMYNSLENALDTPAGKEMKLNAEEVLLEPIDNLSIVLKQMAKTLKLVNESGYYKDVFVEFENLNNNIDFKY